MKTVLLILSLCCSIQLMAQISGPCPCGYALTIETSKFNFHKPRTDCTSGFGLCLRLGRLSLDCYPCYSKEALSVGIHGDIVSGYLHIEGNRYELVLPASLLPDNGMEKTEALTFSLEDGSIEFEGSEDAGLLSVVGADYPIEIKENLIVIPVSFNRL